MRSWFLAGLTAALLLLGAGRADAAIVVSTYKPLGGQHWSALFSVAFDQDPAPIGEFTIYFAPDAFDHLALIASPGKWDSLVIQPDVALQSAGYLDAIPLNPADALVTGQTLVGFVVEFDFHGSGPPGRLPFDIVAADFSVVSSGYTSPVPEPSIAALFSLALGLLLLRRCRRAAGPVLAATAVVLMGCGGGDRPAEATESASSGRADALSAATTPAGTLPQVIGLTKVSETRVGRTLFDYVFKITLRNGSEPLTQVTARLLAAGPGSSIVDGDVAAGDLAADAVVTPADTITLRVDRSLPFDLAALAWKVIGSPDVDRVNGIAVPPVPDPVSNAATLDGIDVNANGLRDDIERKLAADFGAVPAEYAAAAVHARTLGAALVTPIETNLSAHLAVVSCTDAALLARLRAVTIATLDTPLRRKTYGEAFAGSLLSNERCVK